MTTTTTTTTGRVSLRFERRGSVAILVIDNTGRRNAMSPAMMRQLDDHVWHLVDWSGGGGEGAGRRVAPANDDARAVILTGARGSFCSGLDLRDGEDDVGGGGGGGGGGRS